MVFDRLFGRGGEESTDAYREGQRLFDLGKQHGLRFEIDKALEYFDKSYEVHKYPAPLVDRGHIKMMRLRHFEAMHDLLEAQRLDAKIGNKFKHEIMPRLSKLAITTEPYRNGMRDKLIADLRQNGRGYVAQRILLTCFKVKPEQWEFARRAPPLMKFHFFNELDNVAKFETPGSHPEIEKYIQLYPRAYIDEQMRRCPDEQEYFAAEAQLHTFLCSYEEQDMRKIRSDMLYLIHSALMAEDYGLGAFSILSDEDTHGVIREAHEYLDL